MQCPPKACLNKFWLSRINLVIIIIIIIIVLLLLLSLLLLSLFLRRPAQE